MHALIGTVTTKHGLVHGVKDYSDTHGCTTICKRAYTHSPIDMPMKTVTCVWCVVGMPWPSGVKITPNPCAEVDLGA